MVRDVECKVHVNTFHGFPKFKFLNIFFALSVLLVQPPSLLGLSSLFEFSYAFLCDIQLIPLVFILLFFSPVFLFPGIVDFIKRKILFRKTENILKDWNK